MTWLEPVHGGYVHGRRVRVLTAHIARLIPPSGTVLDVGAGDGHVAEALMAKRPDIQIRGIDPLVRPDARIPVSVFDGTTIPFEDDSFDAVMLVDVAHHASDPLGLLKEVARVTRRVVIIKDHRREGLLAFATLRFMDAVGNRRHGVAMPHHYLSAAEWDVAFSQAGLIPDRTIRSLNLYPWPASWLFDRGLHFIASLQKAR